MKDVSFASTLLSLTLLLGGCAATTEQTEDVSASEDDLTYTAGRCDRVVREDGDDKLCQNAYGSSLDEGAVVYRKNSKGTLRVLQRLLTRNDGHGGFTSIGDAVFYASHGNAHPNVLAVRDATTGRYAKTFVPSTELIPGDFGAHQMVSERCRNGMSGRTGVCGTLCISVDHVVSYTTRTCAPPTCIANVTTGELSTIPDGSPSLSALGSTLRFCTVAEAATLGL
jgi:hypothetical protein